MARSYPASLIVGGDLFLCLKALYVTTGPGDKRMLSLTESLVDCSIVLSQIELVISLRNWRRIKENDTRIRSCKKRVELGSQDSRNVLQRACYL